MPTPASVHIDAALTNLAASRAPNFYVSDLVFPTLGVRKQSDKFFRLDPKRQGFRAMDDIRAPGTQANKADVGDPTSDSYLCDDHSLQIPMTDEELANSDLPGLEAQKIGTLRELVALNKEVDLVTQLVAGVSKGAPNVKWDNASGDLVADIKAKMIDIEAAVGRAPNCLTIPSDVLLKVSEKTSWKDRVKYTMNPEQVRGMGLASILAAMCDLQEVNVTRAYKNTAAQGQTASMSSVWGEYSLLYYKEAPSTQYVGLGLTFRFLRRALGAPFILGHLAIQCIGFLAQFFG